MCIILEEKHMEETQFKRHSGLGTASAVIALVLVVTFFELFLIVGAITKTSADLLAEDSSVTITIALLIILGLAASLVGIGLGIAGIFHRNRRKIFAILGVIFNVVLLRLVWELVCLTIDCNFLVRLFTTSIGIKGLGG
ncbi:MAG: hypothetical protein D6736_01645 [Nitrospinota bacterium]|nr:MAG: hypothetical protein D6736_01645 [Nitrospinota bacterium]